MSWSKNLKKRARFSEPLRKHTAFKIGGPAKLFLRPLTLRKLRELIKDYRRSAKKVLILGAGSNLLVSDQGIDAAVVKLDAADFTKIKKAGDLVEAGAGKPINQLLAYCAKNGLSGLEFMAGIPGTVGGALAMNAGVSVSGRNLAIGDLVEQVKVMDYNGQLIIFDRTGLKFGYRESNLDKFVILSAAFKLKPRSKREVASNIAGYILRRKTSLDYSFPNAGCVFKNPPGDSAGRLIDSCGLKGSKIGGAEVSLKHGNFILNSGNASSGDVLALMRLIKKEVKKKYNISLKPEIKIWE